MGTLYTKRQDGKIDVNIPTNGPKPVIQTMTQDQAKAHIQTQIDALTHRITELRTQLNRIS